MIQVPFWPNPSNYHEIELGLSRVLELLKRLNDPHLKIPPTIHIAGTNGKGSTLSFTRSILEELDLKVHLYTSPHLAYFNERILLSGERITDDFLAECLTECKKAAEKFPTIPVTFFEGITVAAFLAFSRIPADILLLETGMGGRLDATNVLPKVLSSIITPIAFDHTDFLGKTLTKIAFEKAGIIKKNCPVIIGKQKSQALYVLENQALVSGSEVKIFGRDWKIKKQKSGFIFTGFDQEIHCQNPSLLGDHQIENASVAIACLLTQKHFKIDFFQNHLLAAKKKRSHGVLNNGSELKKDRINAAISKSFWPARLQKIISGKFVKDLPQNCDLYLDGSHNLQGAMTVKKFLKKQTDRKIFVIFSMLNDKDCEGFLKIISTEIDQLVSIPIPDESRSRNSEEITQIAKKVGISSIPCTDLNEALQLVRKQLDGREKNLILVCGSLYLAGHFLRST